MRKELMQRTLGATFDNSLHGVSHALNQCLSESRDELLNSKYLVTTSMNAQVAMLSGALDRGLFILDQARRIREAS